MRINFDRLSKLAGLPENNSKGSLHESKSYSEGEDHEAMGEMADIAYMNEEDEGDDHEAMSEGEGHEDVDEMIEIDEVMLVQELRRAKRIMNENRRRAQLNESKKKQAAQNIFENQLKRIIDEEVQNVFDEMNISGQWVYGKNKPTRSKKGYTHQGSFIPGIGFKR